jgi:hypothetical protein
MAALRFGPLLFVALLAAATAAAQAPTRVRGTITAASAGGDVISVDNKVQVRLSEQTQIVFAQPIALSEIKPGDFLGVTSIKAADGGLTAYEVRRFPQPLNPGHRPFDGRDDQTMTNATVGAVVHSASGRQLALTYDGGVQHITVPETASVSQLVPGNRAQLVPGSAVSLTHDANGVAIRIQVSPAAAKPPPQ